MKPTDNYWIKHEKDEDGDDLYYILSAPKKLTADMKPELEAIFFDEALALRVSVLLSLYPVIQNPLLPGIE